MTLVINSNYLGHTGLCNYLQANVYTTKVLEAHGPLGLNETERASVGRGSAQGVPCTISGKGFSGLGIRDNGLGR